jgi:hypothetical protein
MASVSPTPEQSAWVRKVLGVEVAAGSGSTSQLLPLWRQTRAELDAQIDTLQKALRRYDHPDLHAIAEYGFNGLTGRSNTAMLAALFEYDAAPGPDRASAVYAAIDGYGAMLEPNSVLDDYDANPLGAQVRLRATLQGGLDVLRATLERAGAGGGR